MKLRVLEKLHNLTTLRHQDAVSRIINYTHNTTKYSKENMKRMREFIDINDRYRRHKFNSLFYELNDILENECRI